MRLTNAALGAISFVSLVVLLSSFPIFAFVMDPETAEDSIQGIRLKVDENEELQKLLKNATQSECNWFGYRLVCARLLLQFDSSQFSAIQSRLHKKYSSYITHSRDGNYTFP